MIQQNLSQTDGVHALVPHNQMTVAARKLRDTYALVPNMPFYQKEFGFYSLEAWKEQGMPESGPEVYFDPPAAHSLGQVGWCEAGFAPRFEEKLIEDRGDTEVVRDFAGRHVLYFKGRRSGFMPEYLVHPVRDYKTWEEAVKWRLNPASQERYTDLDERMTKAKACAAEGEMIFQNLVGGYMYLRSLMGPAEVLYMFYDAPDLVHDCMRTWFELADAVIACHQEHVTLDVVFLAEDICYNHGPLISPDLMREFLFPYYQQLLRNIKGRQIDRTRHLYIQIDTDGYAVPVISIYKEIGMDAMLPFEVASGCDVVAVGRQYPELVILGGIDKRILAKSKADIDREVERILPVMRRRGGYIPTCDHGVPAEVPYENYVHFRKRCLELGGCTYCAPLKAAKCVPS